MDISSIQSSEQAIQSASSATQQPSGDAVEIDANFDTFLSLLTAQLRNQDPLEPVDSTEFVAQLAQFSAVEQQVETNEVLRDIMGLLGGADLASLAPLIGMEATAPGDVYFDGDPINLALTPNPEATAAVLVVQNLDGTVVERVPVDPKATHITWDGSLPNGEETESGRYRFEVETRAGEQVLPLAQATAYQTVTEIRYEDGEPTLGFRGGGGAPLSSVLTLRDSGPDQ